MVLDDRTLAPFLRASDFNHYVVGWKAAVDAGSSALAVVAVNGGLGMVLGDAGADASVDASVDDAGNVTAPYYRRGTVAPWPNYPPPGTLRLGGAPATYPRGAMDDFALWNRVLSAAEIAELYESPTSIKLRCQLP
jgi:hypothetical protein